MARAAEEYKIYLLSKHWQQWRLEVLAFWEHRCALCYSRENVEVHHRTYERLGNERLTDCIVLCARCHKLHTNFTGHFLAGVYAGVQRGR
jgi:hypothetical protein